MLDVETSMRRTVERGLRVLELALWVRIAALGLSLTIPLFGSAIGLGTFLALSRTVTGLDMMVTLAAAVAWYLISSEPRVRRLARGGAMLSFASAVLVLILLARVVPRAVDGAVFSIVCEASYFAGLVLAWVALRALASTRRRTVAAQRSTLYGAFIVVLAVTGFLLDHVLDRYSSSVNQTLVEALDIAQSVSLLVVLGMQLQLVRDIARGEASLPTGVGAYPSPLRDAMVGAACVASGIIGTLSSYSLAKTTHSSHFLLATGPISYDCCGCSVRSRPSHGPERSTRIAEQMYSRVR